MFENRLLISGSCNDNKCCSNNCWRGENKQSLRTVTVVESRHVVKTDYGRYHLGMWTCAYGICVYSRRTQIETEKVSPRLSHGSQNLSKMMIGMVRDQPVSTLQTRIFLPIPLDRKHSSPVL
ncbi:hypothetical protein CBL_00894 [Carabus blaptoides fortunei]